MELTDVGRTVAIEKRLLQPDEHIDEVFKRIAKNIAQAEEEDKREYWEEKFYEIMQKGWFLPNYPTLRNAQSKDGSIKGLLSACVVLDIEDSRQSIFETLRDSVECHAHGAGVGYNFSKLRPDGGTISTTGGKSSGPLSFMKVFDLTLGEVIQQGGCIVPDSRIYTNKGSKKIGDLVTCNEGEQLPIKGIYVDTDEGKRKATHEYNNGEQETIKITTSLGYSFEGTPNHKIKIINETGDLEWKRLDEIQKNDIVALKPCDTFPDWPKLKSVDKGHFNEKEINLPEKMSTELCELLGLIAADGCHSAGRTLICCSSEDMLNRVRFLAKSLFNIECNIHGEHEGYTDINIGSTRLVRFLKENGIAKTEKSPFIRMPEVLFECPKEGIESFMRGYFEGDGTVTKDGIPLLASTSKEMLEECQYLLLSVGIISVIYKKKSNRITKKIGRKKVTKHYRPGYDLAIKSKQTFMDNIGFISSYKNERLRKTISHETCFIYNISSKIKEIYKNIKLPSNNSDKKLMRKAYNPNRNKITKTLLSRFKKDYQEFDTPWVNQQLSLFQDTITSIEKGKSLTLDLTVDDNHTYIANGFISHNTRAGASLACLEPWHPNIRQFISIKKNPKELNHFNLSVLVTDDFMEKARNEQTIDLINPHNQKKEGEINASVLLHEIAQNALDTGCPGLLFKDAANRDNPFPDKPLDSVNPCSETYLYGEGEVCTLGAINFPNAIKLSEEEFKDLITTAVRFLDNIIDINCYPLERMEAISKKYRKIGIGGMGVADLLIEKGIPYNSQEGRDYVTEIYKKMNNYAFIASQNLAKERGTFEAFEESTFEEPIRNSYRTLQQPTGTLSILGNCSAGIEPIFSLIFYHRTSENVFKNTHPIFKKMMEKEGLWEKDLIEKIEKNKGSIQNLSGIPEHIKKVFVTAHDIHWKDHVLMLTSVQPHLNNGISKTVNLPHDAKLSDVKEAMFMAHEKGAKSISFYRDGTKKEQPQSFSIEEKKKEEKNKGIDRTKVVKGQTEKIDLGECGKLYVTINSNEDKIVEVFAFKGASGSCSASHIEAMCRWISVALRWGTPVDKIIEQAKQIKCDKISYDREEGKDKPDKVTSCAMAIVLAMERYIKRNELGKTKKVVYTQERCPKCEEGFIIHEEGCEHCSVCPYSRC